VEPTEGVCGPEWLLREVTTERERKWVLAVTAARNTPSGNASRSGGNGHLQAQKGAALEGDRRADEAF